MLKYRFAVMLMEAPGFTKWYASFVISVSNASSGAMRMLTAKARLTPAKAAIATGQAIMVVAAGSKLMVDRLAM